MPYPVLKNSAQTVRFPIFDGAGGFLTGATPVVKISVDDGTFATSTNSASEIATASGIYKIALTAAETNGDVIQLRITSGGPSPIFREFYTTTRQLSDLAFPTTSGRSMDVSATGEVDANVATWLASAVNALVSGRVDASAGAIAANAIAAAAIATGAITSAKFAAGAIDAASIASNAIAAAKIASGAITSAKFAAGAIDAAAIADGAIDAATFAAGAVNAAAIADGAIDAATFAAGAINAAALNADINTYQATVKLTDDNAGTTDRYTVVWYKNSAPLTAGVTSPTIQVIKAADGTDLVASTAMTEIGTTETFRYNEATNRVVDGAAYIAKVEATIDGATQRWEVVGITRDSS